MDFKNADAAAYSLAWSNLKHKKAFVILVSKRGNKKIYGTPQKNNNGS